MAEEKRSKTGYQPQEHEERISKLWEQSGFFNPDELLAQGIIESDAPVFSMVLPPPNATGTLHTGSAAMLAIEDTFVRFHRMLGRRTLWLPGTDHAAIATQSKVERLLWEETKQTRYDLGREALLRRIDEFVETNRDTMRNQMRKMGASLDWSREAFTLDSARHQAVNRAFKTMYDDGIIYRGDRIVNWDPQGQTTLSDDEIVHKEEQSQFYYLRYGPFTIGTARPETKFGDKYVVMHPDDERYASYRHGDTLTLEWINGPITATIIKDESIDPEFGTGVMTITPWHSQVDFEIAERHKLDREQIIDLEGKLLPIAGEFAGMSIADAREKIVAKLQNKGLVEKIDDQYVHQIATAERTGATIEPQIMRQWFIDVEKEFERDGKKKTLKLLMQEAVRGGDIGIVPERFEKNYFHWIDNLRPWCISRQIWYGHRIPVWYRPKADQPRAGSSQEIESYCDITPPSGDGWEQDPDTLDTWFSSGLWTFSTLGWGSDDAQWQAEKIYHPTSLLETGYDILFFWIARMILMSTYLLGEVPFKTVYLHGLVRDENGRKMSKSLDNIVDPLDVIATYGTDALRLALTSGNTPGNDMRVGEEKLTAMRNFVNKLYNMSRYVEMQTSAEESVALNTPADHFIAAHLQGTQAAVTQYLAEYNLSLAIDTLREFTLSDLADWYIEIHKIEKNTALLRMVFRETLALWHPFAPFVTEAIYQELYRDEKNPNDLLMISPYAATSIPAADPRPVAAFVDEQLLISEIRQYRSMYRILPKTPLTISTTTLSPSAARLANVQAGKLATQSIVVGRGTKNLQSDLYIGEAIDVTAEKKRLQKELAEATQHRSALATRLAAPEFMSKAPRAIQEETKRLAEEAHERAEQLQQALDNLN